MTKELSYFFKVALFSISGFWKNADRIKIKEIWSFQKEAEISPKVDRKEARYT